VNKIDWSYLKGPLIMFGVAALIAAALVALGYQYEKSQNEQYQQALSTLKSTHSQYRTVVSDIGLLEQYRTLYTDYKASGLVGEERRLIWIESLEDTNEVLRLPTLTYNLYPQEDFARPKFKAKSGVAVKSSPMDLTMGLLHEEDLFVLLESLRESIKTLFTVESCSMLRQSGIERSFSTKATNLVGRCTIRWVTIDAK